MLRTLGFIIGLGLASVGLLFLLDVSLALQVREAAVSHVRQLADPLLGRDWQHEEPLPVDQSALPPPMRASDPARVPPPRDVAAAVLDETEVSAPSSVPDPKSEVDALLDALASQATQEAVAEPSSWGASQASSRASAEEAVQPIDAAGTAPSNSEPTAERPASMGDSPAAPARRWHAFWSPFRTERAAQGFAARLSELTGLEVSVLTASVGEYQVAFAYRDEAERRAAVETIERQAGLDISESPMR